MRIGRLTDLALIAALAISGAMFIVLLPQRYETGASLLIVFMTLSILATSLVTKRLVVLRTPMRRITRPEAAQPSARGSRHASPALVQVEDPAATDEDFAVSVLLDTKVAMAEPDYHAGHIEIRPGVWAFDDGVPEDVLRHYLERRRASHHTPA